MQVNLKSNRSCIINHLNLDAPSRSAAGMQIVAGNRVQHAPRSNWSFSFQP
jgi:hypothetical protein